MSSTPNDEHESQNIRPRNKRSEEGKLSRFWRRTTRLFRKFLGLEKLHAWGPRPAIVSLAGAVLVMLLRLIPIDFKDGTFEEIRSNAYIVALGLALLAILLFIQGLFKRVGRQVDYRAATEYDDLYTEARRLAGAAKEEILIVNRWPDDRPERSDREKGYYEELRDFVERGGRLVRVLQLPTTDARPLGNIEEGQIQEWFRDGFFDTHLLDHIKSLVEWRHSATSRSEEAASGHYERFRRISIQVAPMMTTSTFVVYDKTVVLLPIYEGNPFVEKNEREIQMVGVFVISDPSGNLIAPFMDLYWKISAHAIPVQASFLETVAPPT